MAVTADRPAPYAPPKVLLAVIDRFRNRGLQVPLDSDVLARAGVSDSLIARTLQSMQTLDLIDDAGNPTETFEGLQLAPEAEYKKRLEDWLKAAYGDVFAFVDPTQDDETHIRDAFRSYNPRGQQDRMVTLFTGLCVAAGLIPEKTTSASRPRAPAAPRQQRQARVVQATGTAGRRKSSQPDLNTGGIPAPLAGLLAGLPPAEIGWPKAKRDSFMAAFGSALDFCVPIVETSAATERNDGDP